MTLKIFILGRPGSGKTSAARYISKLAISRGLSSIHLNDYDILKRMFLADTEHLIFRPTEHDGFDVRDFSTLDIALQALEKEIEEHSATEDIITIEFARDDYHQALKNFYYDLIYDACFLYIDVNIETCLQRIHKRVALPTTEDDHPSFSDEIFKVYYRKDHKLYMLSEFLGDFSVVDKQVRIIENEDLYEHFLDRTSETLDTFLELYPSLLQKQGILTGSAM